MWTLCFSHFWAAHFAHWQAQNKPNWPHSEFSGAQCACNNRTYVLGAFSALKNDFELQNSSFYPRNSCWDTVFFAKIISVHTKPERCILWKFIIWWAGKIAVLICHRNHGCTDLLFHNSHFFAEGWKSSFLIVVGFASLILRHMLSQKLFCTKRLIFISSFQTKSCMRNGCVNTR